MIKIILYFVLAPVRYLWGLVKAALQLALWGLVLSLGCLWYFAGITPVQLASLAFDLYNKLQPLVEVALNIDLLNN